MDFTGKNAVVTGAARGIGFEISRMLASKGASVAVVDLNKEESAAAAERISGVFPGSKCRAYGCNVASFDETSAAGDKILKDMDHVDFLINNAGIVRDKLLIRMKPDDWNAVIAVNLTGTFNITKALAPHMLTRRYGRIVSIASVIGLVGNAGQANYAASKAGIIGFTKSAAKEFASRGITVNAVAPGFINTPMTDALSDEVRNKMLEAIPLTRFGETKDVTNVVLFLLSDFAGYVTGQVLNCDGGMVMAG